MVDFSDRYKRWAAYTIVMATCGAIAMSYGSGNWGIVGGFMIGLCVGLGPGSMLGGEER